MTGGYRAKFSLARSGGSRDAVYVDFFGVLTLADVAARIERAYATELEGSLGAWFTGIRRRLRPTLRLGAEDQLPAELELSLAQLEQTKSRLDELKINLANTVIVSPVDGFIGKRTLDPGASVGVNTRAVSSDPSIRWPEPSADQVVADDDDDAGEDDQQRGDGGKHQGAETLPGRKVERFSQRIAGHVEVPAEEKKLDHDEGRSHTATSGELRRAEDHFVVSYVDLRNRGKPAQEGDSRDLVQKRPDEGCESPRHCCTNVATLAGSFVRSSAALAGSSSCGESAGSGRMGAGGSTIGAGPRATMARTSMKPGVFVISAAIADAESFSVGARASSGTGTGGRSDLCLSASRARRSRARSERFSMTHEATSAT